MHRISSFLIFFLSKSNYFSFNYTNIFIQDALLRVQMRLELAKLHQTLKTTMIYVTHDQVEAMTLADKIVVLDKGVIAQAGSPLELYNYPANRFVASFIGSPAMNFVQGSIKSITGNGATLQLLGDVTLNLGNRKSTLKSNSKEIEIGIRPEHMTLVSPDDKRAVFKGKTTVVEQLGNTTYAYIDTPAGLLIVEADSTLPKTTGTAVGIAVNSDHTHVFEQSGNAV